MISFSEICHIAVRDNFPNKVKWDISDKKKIKLISRLYIFKLSVYPSS